MRQRRSWLGLAVVTGAGLVSSGCAVGLDGIPLTIESVTVSD
ncbi:MULTISPECIES: hypothetical protein [unclassified Gordonia (in: high G+C Gram-positive bacteria)]